VLARAIPSASGRQQGLMTHAVAYITLPHLETAAASLAQWLLPLSFTDYDEWRCA